MQTFITDPDQMPVLDVDKVVELEQRIAENGTSLHSLMLRAGAALDEAAVNRMGNLTTSIAILAGSGNNGGDGWAAASLLLRRGYRVAVITRDSPWEVTAMPARICATMTATVNEHEKGDLLIVKDPKHSVLQSILDGADLIIDCIFGTGFANSEVREPYAHWIDEANLAREQYKALILSADVPSGLFAQTGMRADHCIKADGTVSMLACKPGLRARIAEEYVGELAVAPLGIDVAAYGA